MSPPACWPPPPCSPPRTALSASDPRKSHRSIGSTEGFDEQELTQRLQDAQDLSALIDLADKIRKNPDKFPKVSDPVRNKLLDEFLNDPNKQKLLKDRRVQELFRDAMKNQKLSDKQLQDLGKQLDKIPPEDLRKLAEEASKHPGLDDQDREALRKIAEQWKAGQKPADLDKLRDIFNKVGQNPDLPPDDLDALKRTLPTLPSGPGDQGPGPMEPPTVTDPMNPASGPAIPEPASPIRRRLPPLTQRTRLRIGWRPSPISFKTSIATMSFSARWPICCVTWPTTTAAAPNGPREQSAARRTGSAR